MTLALALIRLLRPFAPRVVRDRWVEEWRAEIAHAGAVTAGRRWSALRLLRFAAGAVPDLIALRRLPRTRSCVGSRRAVRDGGVHRCVEAQGNRRPDGLGARPLAIVRLMMAQGIRTALVGAAGGGVIALDLSGALRAQMFGVPPIDFVALVASSALLLGVVVVASLIPARSASRVDPLVVLRDE